MSGRPGVILMAKDLRLLRRSPLLVAILVIYPVALALMIGVALGAPPGRPRVAVYNGVASGHGVLHVGGSSVDIGAYTRQLARSLQPVRAASPAAAVAAVRSGRVAAAIIVPADILAQARSLIVDGIGAPTVQIVLNAADPLERDLVNAQIQTRVDEVQAAISRALLGTALSDLHTVVSGGRLSFAGASVSLLGLRDARTVVADAIPLVSRAGLRATLAPALAQVVSFANIAIEGLSVASPVLGQLSSPLTVQRRELSAQSTPTSQYAVAIAVTVSELFLALLLAAALLALERSEGVLARLLRSRLGAIELLGAKVLTAALAAAAVALVLSAVVSIFVAVEWSRFELWVLCLGLAGIAFAALGVAVGALAREVAAASLLAILVGLPVAFLALIPAVAVSSGVGAVISAISFVFPFRAGLEAVSWALTGAGPGPGLGLSLVHLLGLAGVYLFLARVALGRFAR